MWVGTTSGAQAAAPAERANLPVREVTVFKDGHAFVLHAGQAATDANGDVQLDRLPTPVLGTFWPYAADKNATLASVTASSSKTRIERPALSVSELLEANPGAQIIVTQPDGHKYDAQIVATPRYVPDPANAPNPTLGGFGGGFGGFGRGGFMIRDLLPRLQLALSAPPGIVLLKTREGEQAVPLSAIHSITFKGAYKRALATEEMRSHLSLKLAWKDGKPARTANVGMVYLQKGIRWIPEYRISIDDKGHALVSLQATLLNEMLDLKDVTCHLVVGVPTFWFKDMPDPISLQQTFPQLSRFFQTNSQTAYAFSNAIAGQSPGFGGGGMAGGGGGGAGGGQAGAPAEGLGTDRNEDLFLFTVPHITLKRGQNMTLPVTQFTLDYKDVYRLDVPINPPTNVHPNGSQAEAELARMLRAPRPQHRIRLINKSNYPITTAPALITNGDRVIAQTITSYTSVGATLDLALTTAGNLGVKRTETETKRTSDAEIWRGDHLARYDMIGKLSITNYDDKPIDLEIARYVPGQIDTANQGGVFRSVNSMEEDASDAIGGDARPVWWGWYNWPSYWTLFNGLNHVMWNAQLAPKASADFIYTWHYFSSP